MTWYTMIEYDYREVIAEVESADDLRAALSAFREIAIEAVDIAADWDDVDVARMQTILEFDDLNTGVDADHAGLCSTEFWVDAYLVSNPPILAALSRIKQAGYIASDGTILLQLLEFGHLTRHDDHWHLADFSPD